MYQVIIVIHVLLGLGVIGLVLIQHGKGADAGAAFGSASSGSVFGAQGASSFLSRATAILATLFFTTSLGLAVLSGQSDVAVDLMDTPEAQEKFTDVPLINDDSIPVINEETNGLGLDTPPTLDSLPVLEENATEAVNQLSEEIKTVVPEVIDPALDKAIITE